MGNINLPIWVVVYWTWNLAAFLMVRADKQYARTRKRRVRESTFWQMAFFCGAAGILMGMYVYRHKTLHTSFVVGMPLMLAGNLVCLYILL